MKKSVLVLVLIVVLLLAGFAGEVPRADDQFTHARLYFSQEELVDLRALQTAPSHQAIWNNIKSWADAHISDVPPAQPAAGDSAGVWTQTAARIRQHIETMGFMYAITEDTLYADAAKDWMLSVSAWSLWDWKESHGQTTRTLSMGMAFGYDVLYNYLSPSERDTIVQAMVTHITPMYNSRIANPSYGEGYGGTIATTASAIGLAALALHEDYDGASDWLNFSISEAQRVLLDYGGQDGGWYEGLSYGPYTMDGFVPFLDALKRMTGQDLFAGSGFLENQPYYYIYLTYNGRPLQFEDCNWYEGHNPDYLTFIYRLASEYNNGYTQWFADNYASQSLMQSFIWKNPDVVAVSPASLPLTRHFDDTGYVVTRSGWGSNDLVFAFKSGSSRGHAHPSQNEFHIYSEGKPITCGVGYVTLEPEDATWSHNCILVNGEGQGQEPGDYGSLPLGTRGEIKQVDINDPYYAYILGDATAPYDGKLNKWLRHVVFIEPSYFVIYDEVAASSAKQFDWLLHLKNIGHEDYNLSVDGDTITLAKTGGTPVSSTVKLQVVVVEPEGFAYDIIHYHKPSGLDYDYIKVRPAENTSSTRFLTVHYPLAQDESALLTEKVRTGNLIGAKVTDGENLDLILFSRDGNPVDEYIELGDYYQPADGNTYSFDGTRVRAHFDKYQVMRLSLGMTPTPELIVDMWGKVTSGERTALGVLLETIEAISADEVVTLLLSQGTTVVDYEGDAVARIRVNPIALPPSLPAPPQGHMIDAYNFIPRCEFDPSVVLTILYDEAALAGIDEQNLVIEYYHRERQEWVELPTIVDTWADTVTASIDHFTVLAVVAVPHPELTLAGLLISHTEVYPGESLDISVLVTNNGDATGSRTVELQIDGEVEGSQEVALAPGDGETITFTVTKDELGTYRVAVDGLAGEFVVAALPVVPTGFWVAVWSVVGLLVIAGAIVLYFWRRRPAYSKSEHTGRPLRGGR